MTDTGGRFTARGGPEAEAESRALVAQLAGLLNSRIRPPELIALLLVGDFGRGEGRVFTDPSGAEHPFGDLEFLLLTANLAAPERAGLEQRLSRDLGEQALPSGLSAGIRVVNLAQMRTAPCSVYWCDVRFGHKLLLGDASSLLTHEAFGVDHVPPIAARDHLIQSSLPWLAGLPTRSASGQRAHALHVAEAAVGHGSALLLLLGDYHWSLQERQCRMDERDDISEAVRTAFHEGCEHLLRLDGEIEPCADTGLLAEMHLACERMRLRAPEMTWAQYPELACRATLWHVARAPLTLAVRTIDPPVATHARGLNSWGARLGLRCAPREEALALVHPVVAYGLDLPDYSALAAQVLDVEAHDTQAARRAFVHAWVMSQDQDVYASVARAGSVTEGMPTAA